MMHDIERAVNYAAKLEELLDIATKRNTELLAENARLKEEILTLREVLRTKV